VTISRSELPRAVTVFRLGEMDAEPILNFPVLLIGVSPRPWMNMSPGVFPGFFVWEFIIPKLPLAIMDSRRVLPFLL
jgi:hypothetical protein